MKNNIDRIDTPNKLAHKTFEGWMADDYRDFAKLVTMVQKMQYDKLIDFFKAPDSHIFDDGTRVADYLSGQQ